MSGESNLAQVLSFEAENDFAEKYVCVELGSGDDQVDLPDSSNEAVIGITQATAEAGQAVPVAVEGVSLAVAGGAITKGKKVSAVTTTGRIQEATDPTGTWTGTEASTEHVIGIALESASAAGEIIPVLISRMTIAH